MKKNRMMRMASTLLVAVLLTTCTISGTFAKYVTEKTGTDSARVAKFGVEIVANGSTFAQEYETHDPAVKATIAKSVVTSGDMKDLVAPGTNGEMVAMTLKGIPEVAVNVKYNATLTINDKWKDWNGKEYFPIYFKVNDRTFGTDDSGLEFDVTSANIAALITDVQNAINAYSKDYPAHTDLSKEGTVATPDVEWFWAFSTSPENDKRDTFLGDTAAANVGNAGTIELAVTTTVTQID